MGIGLGAIEPFPWVHACEVTILLFLASLFLKDERSSAQEYAEPDAGTGETCSGWYLSYAEGLEVNDPSRVR
jgi:hypothetical protein